MTTLLIGFDSAWTAQKSGAIIGVIRPGDGRLVELGPPQAVNFLQAEELITTWQAKFKPDSILVLLDQPTIVPNATGQRPVEHIVSSAVSLRRGGMQPANTSRDGMFCASAPVWNFLSRFGGAADPRRPIVGTSVYETYPVLAMIALDWLIKDSRPAGRLPKYNPDRRKTFSLSDWQHVCGLTSEEFRKRGLNQIFHWIDAIREKPSPRKLDQDGLDACICLLVALHLAEGKDCLMVGDVETGYIVVPDSAGLRAELDARCCKTGRSPARWLRVFRESGE
jgi:predicted RNase H-like nuclease